MPVFSSLSLRYEELALGSHFRDERLRRGLTLRDLTKKCAMSTARLSQIENGLREPTLDQAERIAAALAVPLAGFFPRERAVPYQIARDVDTRAQSPRTAVLVRHDGGRQDHHNLFWPLADQFVGRQIEPLLGRIMPVSDKRASFCRHHDLEFVSVLKGNVEFQILTPQERRSEHLQAGDCLLFQSSLPHCLRSLESGPAETLHVLAAASIASETAWDWFAPHAAAYLDETCEGNAGRPIGAELRLLRNARGWSLAEVADLVDLSVHRLEKFEEGRRSLPMSKMVAFARLFGRPLRSLLGADTNAGPHYFLQRKADVGQTSPRIRRAVGQPTSREPLHTFHPLTERFHNQSMFPYLIRAHHATPPSLDRREHHGQEFFYVLDGELELTISVEGTTVQQTLRPGDACYLDSSVPHVATGRAHNPYSATTAEVIGVFWCPLGESYLFED
jgi:transcriptional regulator with XRE-family HTH domain